MKNLFLKFALLILLGSLLSGNDQLYFMPYEQKNALDTLIKTIESSERSIDISIYAFTNKEIEKALKNAARRGVKIRIIYDYKSNINNSHSTIGSLSKYNNIKTCLLRGTRARNDEYNGIMHQKMAIIDTKAIIMGSANWTRNAFENNYELLIKSDDMQMINKAKAYFSNMFSLCTPY